jgi:hypothetical protein
MPTIRCGRMVSQLGRRTWAPDRVTGLTADRDLKSLRFGLAEICEPVHRRVATAVADIRRECPEVAEIDLVITGAVSPTVRRSRGCDGTPTAPQAGSPPTQPQSRSS